MTLTLTYPGEQQTGLGLTVAGSENSAADLLDVWQPLCDDEKVYKQFAAGNHAACISCINNCCNTAYVTPDIISLRLMAKRYGLSLPDFAARFLDADKLALGIPVLKRPCPWLTDDGRCDVYQIRSLLCRLYLCTPLEGQLEQLIYSLTLVGMIATIEELGADFQSPNQAMTSFDRLNLQEIKAWRTHPGVKAFRTAASYSELPLNLFL
ncbi:MAG: YkgJ family cysteine cluster protein [Methylocystaceae bacterium]